MCLLPLDSICSSETFVRSYLTKSIHVCLNQVLADLGTFLHKAIPDTRMTIGRYADAKFEYLSYCLKVWITYGMSDY
jgi:hypothetical protein